ncbi:hypothetical protein DFJ74DRAFT_304317 [Hyaloraphidium curvatum]|nr:hypothetical protein DFJ74DRAFT_304317 [Hyaloraphidium curvatum]
MDAQSGVSGHFVGGVGPLPASSRTSVQTLAKNRAAPVSRRALRIITAHPPPSARRERQSALPRPEAAMRHAAAAALLALLSAFVALGAPLEAPAAGAIFARSGSAGAFVPRLTATIRQRVRLPGRPGRFRGLCFRRRRAPPTLPPLRRAADLHRHDPARLRCAEAVLRRDNRRGHLHRRHRGIPAAWRRLGLRGLRLGGHGAVLRAVGPAHQLPVEQGLRGRRRTGPDRGGRRPAGMRPRDGPGGQWGRTVLRDLCRRPGRLLPRPVARRGNGKVEFRQAAGPGPSADHHPRLQGFSFGRYGVV